jgi:hypothetical protein
LREEELNIKLESIQNNKEEINRNKEKVLTFSESRDEEHKEYEKRRDEMVTMINGLKEAKQIVSELSSGKSFLEVK